MTTTLQFSVDQVEEARQEAFRLRIPDVELTLTAAQLPMLVERLRSLDERRWYLKAVIIREPGDLIDGTWIAELKTYGLDRIQTVLDLNEHEPERTCHELHFLRECATQYIRVEWTLGSTAPIDCEPLVHLPAPQQGASAPSDWVSRWQTEATTEGLRYRRGPQFIVLRDYRPISGGQIIQLEEQADLDLFWLTREPKRVDEVLQAVPSLHVERYLELWLGVRVGDWMLSLVTPTNKKVIPYL